MLWHFTVIVRATVAGNVRQMTTDRMAGWRAASLQSFWPENHMNEMLWLIQMLGREDVALYKYEQMLNADWENIARGQPTQAVDDALHQMVWRAYTWILASYELVRTVSQKLQTTAPQINAATQARELKDEFTRLRVPLVKFEPAGKHKHTDYQFPVVCIQPTRGLCWQVAEGVVVSRMELSDRLLAFLSALKAYGTEKNNADTPSTSA